MLVYAVQNQDEDTALHHAALGGRCTAMRLLIDHAASVDARNQVLLLQKMFQAKIPISTKSCQQAVILYGYSEPGYSAALCCFELQLCSGAVAFGQQRYIECSKQGNLGCFIFNPIDNQFESFSVRLKCYWLPTWALNSASHFLAAVVFMIICLLYNLVVN